VRVWSLPLTEELFQHIQTIDPEALVKTQPLVSAGKRSGRQAAQMGAPSHLATNQPGILQYLDVLRGGRKRDIEGFCKLANGSLALGQLEQHLPTRGVAERTKYGIQLGLF
jgi:hypothetical protein